MMKFKKVYALLNSLASERARPTQASATQKDEFLRRELVSLADAARDRRQYIVAAELYDRSLKLGQVSVGILLQCGHMYKEARDFSNAERNYLEAFRLAPKDPEVLLQLGHFLKIVGRFVESGYYYKEALVQRPDWQDPKNELQWLKESSELRREVARQERLEQAEELFGDEALDIYSEDGLVDDGLFPKTRNQLYIDHQEAFVFTRNGNRQRTKWGTGQTVRGVDALRGYIVSPTPYLYIEIFLDSELIYKQKLVIAPQRREKSNRDIKKYVYNAWIDFSKFSYGWHELVFRAVNVRGDVREGTDWRRERIIVAEPTPVDTFQDCDGIIPPLDQTSPLSVVEQINARPSIVHRASSASFPGKIKNVAVIRADQLGDMVVSVQALLRLRQLLPDARITGLLSPAGEGLARTLGVFDEIILLDFPDDPHQRQRVMDRKGQKQLAEKLAAYKFDLAIDFPVAGVSYKLLALTGAPITMGYGGDGFKTLDLNLSTHDPKTNNDVMRHSSRTRALIETFALWLDSGAKVVRRHDLSRQMLVPYGLNTNEDFIVLHSGSRIKFTQWPYYTELAAQIVEKLGLKVVFMAENKALRANLPPEMLLKEQIIYMSQHLDFAVFDAFLSFCSVFVGNDSGPKHLAGLRGAPVVSLHSSRIGWSEWGQEQTGVVISRQVPCAGCSLHHDPEECGQDVACIKYITVDEVFREVKNLLSPAPLSTTSCPPLEALAQ
jgi:ADP-heptose:LPS heptosyltransferase